MTYYPAQQPKTTTPTKCPGCSRWFVPTPGMEMVSCTVLHALGTCCHYSETEVTSDGVPVAVLPSGSVSVATGIVGGDGCATTSVTLRPQAIGTRYEDGEGPE